MSRFIKALLDPKLAPSAAKVALVVGSVLFTINHGSALVKGEMTKARWMSGLITYIIPYSVNIHGQFTSSRRSLKN